MAGGKHPPACGSVTHLCDAQPKARKEPVTSYAPIERTLLMLDESEKGRMRCKYDSCYLMATEYGGHHLREICSVT